MPNLTESFINTEMSSFPTVTELLRTLVRIPSVNPSGTPGTSEVGEAKLAECVADYLHTLGAIVELREVLPGRPNVIGHFPNPRAGKRLLFAPHLDTVSVAGMTIDPFAAELRDGKIYGRGATDTKGTMAATLCALAAMRDSLHKLDYEIWFAGLMGEEAGNDGAIALAEQFTPDFVIAGEPTELQVVHTHKGAAWIDLIARGRSAHGSTPERGVNAIVRMAEVIQFLQAEVIPELNRTTRDPILGPITLNIGRIEGGSKVNIVPDYCRVELDCRTVPAHVGFPGELERTLSERFPELECHLHRQTSPLATAPSHPLIARLQSLGAGLVGAPWFCDAALFADKGVPAIAFGPGSIAQAHTEDEWVQVSDLEAGVRFQTDFLACCLVIG